MMKFVFSALIFGTLFVSLPARSIEVPPIGNMEETQALFRRRTWEHFTVPGAKCGDGSRYRIHISRGDPKKIAFEFMGGGACWNASTCFGPTPHTILKQLPTVMLNGGFSSVDSDYSPVADYTYVHFPYCTGDVHLGNHVATYKNKLVNHVGRKNIELAVAYALTEGQVDFPNASNLVLYGFSAGAIGALLHMNTFNKYPLNRAQSRVLIADAPGLHFGKGFWNKFTPGLMNDYRDALKELGIDLDTETGNIARALPSLCKRNLTWNFAVLQGSRDLIMSKVFGEISMEDHEALAYGPEGIYELSKDPTDNCSAWVPQTKMHTFLVTDTSGKMESENGKSALEYARDEVLGIGGISYR